MKEEAGIIMIQCLKPINFVCSKLPQEHTGSTYSLRLNIISN